MSGQSTTHPLHRPAERSFDREQQLRNDYQDLVHAVSHDVKAPLRAARRFADLLQEQRGDQLDETHKQYLQHIVTGVTMAATMIDALTTLSKIGSKLMAIEPVDMTRLCRDAVCTLAPQIERAGATVTVDPLLPAQGDPQLLGLAFRQLLDNALKFGSTTPRIRVTASETATEQVYSICDNGPGVELADRERVFGVFVRLHPDRPGAGVGLALVKRAVGRHDGRAWIEPAADGGCRARFALPCTTHICSTGY